MLYKSTRGAEQEISFADAVLSGLAPDGGLHLPTQFPKFTHSDLENMRGKSYAEIAFQIMLPFVEDSLTQEELRNLIEKSLKNFRTKAITPLKQLDSDLFLLELFHGPTYAFKDIALQFLGNLLDLLLTKRGEKGVVLGATSGDTGSAAIAGCAFCDNLDIFILHPHNGVSQIQRKQMTSWDSKNIFNIAIEGDFDQAQAIVKECFNNRDFLQGRRLIAVNSINWARILAQSVYYFASAIALGAPARKMTFFVPSANFGDVFAGFIAHKMGLPINKLVVATNANDILHRVIANNDFSRKQLIKTIAPSMDIVVSSNFERLLYQVYGGNSQALIKLLNEFNDKGTNLSDDAWQQINSIFASAKFDDEELLQGIKLAMQNSDELLDPHTASAYLAALNYESDKTTDNSVKVVLATAHPAKFEDAIISAGLNLGQLPMALRELENKTEHYKVMPAQTKDIQDYILQSI